MEPIYLIDILNSKPYSALWRFFYNSKYGEVQTVEEFLNVFNKIDLTNQTFTTTHHPFKGVRVKGIGAISLREIGKLVPGIELIRNCVTCHSPMNDHEYEHYEKICCHCSQI